MQSEAQQTTLNTPDGMRHALPLRSVHTQVPFAAAIPDEAMKVKVIDGGITNALFRVTLDGSHTLRVRVFGGEGAFVRRGHLASGYIAWHFFPCIAMGGCVRSSLAEWLAASMALLPMHCDGP
jgi:hypothetical protein